MDQVRYDFNDVATPVPEPSTMTLITLGLAATTLRARMRRWGTRRDGDRPDRGLNRPTGRVRYAAAGSDPPTGGTGVVILVGDATACGNSACTPGSSLLTDPSDANYVALPSLT